MQQQDWLAERFEANRAHLHGVAYRMLGSLSEADDAVQEVWLRLSRSDTSGVANLDGWLTTVAARVCLDTLRSRSSRREESLDTDTAEPLASDAGGADPEQEALLADAVGLALLVVLETLNPAERVAFVLHDIFAVPFEEIAPIVERSPTAARQLASRARRRVRGGATASNPDRTPQQAVVDAFLAASCEGNFAALLALLDPDVVLRADPATPAGAPLVVRGANTVAKRASFGGMRRAAGARRALVNGAPGIVVAPCGRLLLALGFTIQGDKIAEIDVISDPARLRRLDLALPGD